MTLATMEKYNLYSMKIYDHLQFKFWAIDMHNSVKVNFSEIMFLFF